MLSNFGWHHRQIKCCINIGLGFTGNLFFFLAADIENAPFVDSHAGGFGATAKFDIMFF